MLRGHINHKITIVSQGPKTSRINFEWRIKVSDFEEIY